MARNVLSLDDKTLAKTTQRGKSKTLHPPENKNDFDWLTPKQNHKTRSVLIG